MGNEDFHPQWFPLGLVIVGLAKFVVKMCNIMASVENGEVVVFYFLLR